MRRLIVMLACVIAMLAMALPAVAGPFTDVPTDHWAYDAIDKLQAEGFVEGYPDGTFRGNRSFTRYEMSMVVARIWDRLVQELAAIQMPPMDDYVTYDELQDELALIYELLDEFEGELDALGVRVEDLEGRVNGLDGRVSNLESFLDSINWSGSLRFRIEDIITNDYAMASGPYGGIISGTTGSNPGEMFEAETKVDLSFTAQPSDYLDVFFHLCNIASYSPNPSPGMAMNISDAWVNADMMKLMGWSPSRYFDHFSLKVGRSKNRFGAFGLAFDNTVSARPGILINLGGERLELRAFLARSTYYGVQEGLGIGRVSYGFGDSRSTIAPGDNFARIGFNYLGTGMGNEQGMGLDIDTEVLSGRFFPRLKVEYLQLEQDQMGYDVAASYGDDFESSLIAWADIYDDGNTRISAAYADIGLVPGFSAIDNNPFEEYDKLPTGIGSNLNWSKETSLNPFPSNFVGAGMRFGHTWWDVVDTVLTFYDGTNQNEEDLPVVIRLKIAYPLSDASDIALEYIHSGIDALTLAKLRGEFLVRF